MADIKKVEKKDATVAKKKVFKNVAKKETKAVAKSVEKKAAPAKTVKKATKKVAKKVAKKETPKVPKTKERQKLIEKIKDKSKPVFRGSFGKKSVRRKSIDKWDKWRRPKGGNHWSKRKRYKEDGAWPKPGYRTPLEIRDMHPSGFREVLVNNVKELTDVDATTHAIRIAGTVGKRKRIEIKAKAQELGLKLLNF